MKTFLGIDVGGTNIKYGVVAEDATIVEKKSIATKAFEGRDAVIKRIVEIIKNVAPGTVAPGTVGICVPGIVDPKTRHILSPPNLPGWDDVALADIVREATGVNVVVENDANAAALAELHYGAGRGMSDFVYVTLGTGIGGGVIANGALYVGPHGEAGEIGHIIIDHRAAPLSGAKTFRTGVLEELAGNAGLVRRFLAHSGRTDITDVEAIAKLAAQGNEDASVILEETGTLIGLGICTAMATLGMRNAIIGGGMANSDLIINAARKTVAERALPTIARHSKVVRAQYLDDAGLVGAAMLNRLSLPTS